MDAHRQTHLPATIIMRRITIRPAKRTIQFMTTHSADRDEYKQEHFYHVLLLLT